MEYSKFRFYF